jgi:hypothetical protein
MKGHGSVTLRIVSAASDALVVAGCTSATIPIGLDGADGAATNPADASTESATGPVPGFDGSTSDVEGMESGPQCAADAGASVSADAHRHQPECRSAVHRARISYAGGGRPGGLPGLQLSAHSAGRRPLLHQRFVLARARRLRPWRPIPVPSAGLPFIVAVPFGSASRGSASLATRPYWFVQLPLRQ